jgi:predicted aspartyl protease
LKLGTAVLIGLAVLAEPAAAEPLVVRGNRLFVAAEVNGHPVEALLDSAAEISVADSGAAPGLGLGSGEAVVARGSGGSQAARIVPSAKIAALGLTIADTPVAVTDLSDISARLVGRPVALILGGEFFAAARFRIDIAGQEIAVLQPPAVPQGVELKLHDHAGIKAIPVSSGAVKLLADFDLGNGSDVLVSTATVRRLGLAAVGYEPAGGIGGANLRAVVFIPELTIAGRRFERVRAHVDPGKNAGEVNVGVKLLREFTIVTDFSGGKVWLHWKRP